MCVCVCVRVLLDLALYVPFLLLSQSFAIASLLPPDSLAFVTIRLSWYLLCSIGPCWALLRSLAAAPGPGGRLRVVLAVQRILGRAWLVLASFCRPWPSPSCSLLHLAALGHSWLLLAAAGPYGHPQYSRLPGDASNFGN